MHELDAVLQAFLDDSFEGLGDADKSRFAEVLDLPDPDLYGYIAGRAKPQDRHLARLFGLIRQSLHSRR